MKLRTLMNDDPILPDTCYHIYNRAHGSEKMFLEEANYRYFLVLLQKHLLPYFDVYAYVLMPNHFHLVVRTKTLEELTQITKPKKVSLHSRNPFSQVFSNFCNAYTKAFNKWHKRMGSLFMRPFKRVEIENEFHLMTAIRYVHNNPVHHGYCTQIDEWHFSSYNSFLTKNKTNVQRTLVLEYFGGQIAFLEFHNQAVLCKKNGDYLKDWDS